jgi:hypothetical protein
VKLTSVPALGPHRFLVVASPNIIVRCRVEGFVGTRETVAAYECVI